MLMLNLLKEMTMKIAFMKTICVFMKAIFIVISFRRFNISIYYGTGNVGNTLYILERIFKNTHCFPYIHKKSFYGAFDHSYLFFKILDLRFYSIAFSISYKFNNTGLVKSFLRTHSITKNVASKPELGRSVNIKYVDRLYDSFSHYS